ncbi:hypothetical protein EPO04_03070 [Patescibacteria group bacterium]|nr:MAG: hypothetical protein EPO04_03070 [Patescibacteria group bacterium]
MSQLARTIAVTKQPHDLLLKHSTPVVLRMQDIHHQQIRVGDLVEVQGHNSIMDRQRFRVVETMSHPGIGAAVEHIEGSHSIAVRDKIKMTEAFLHQHGPVAHTQPVMSIHMQPHGANPGLYH